MFFSLSFKMKIKFSHVPLAHGAKTKKKNNNKKKKQAIASLPYTGLYERENVFFFLSYTYGVVVWLWCNDVWRKEGRKTRKHRERRKKKLKQQMPQTAIKTTESIKKLQAFYGCCCCRSSKERERRKEKKKSWFVAQVGMRKGLYPRQNA